MVLKKKSNYIIKSFAIVSLALAGQSSSLAQIHTPFLSHNYWLSNAEQQYHQDLYWAASSSAGNYLKHDIAYFLNNDPIVQKDKAEYIKAIADITSGSDASSKFETVNPVYIERTAYAKAQYYFRKGQWSLAIQEYEKAGIANLNNKEIASSKFELAYCYFNNKQFSEAKALLLSIKDLGGPYANSAHYYFGLLSYNESDYKSALQSFEKIENIKGYQDVVPYYIAEIYYFNGERVKALQKAKAIISNPEKSYYYNELHLLAGQCHFEGTQYKEAIPYFEFYYKNVDKIRKEDLYKMAYCYYATSQWSKAIEPFKQLSTVQDNLGQNAMYLLGDCYLKTNDKQGAKNAFSICSEMPFNEALTEPSLLVSGKLAYELGYPVEGSSQLQKLIADFPKSKFKSEATNILSKQLLQSSHYSEAYEMLHNIEDAEKFLMQKSAYGFALQNMQQSNWGEAERLLNESIENSADHQYEAAAYFWKAEIDYRNKNYSSAIENGKSFLAKNTGAITEISANATTQNALMTLGYASLNAQKFTEARNYFAQAQDKKSSNTYSAKLASDAALREADAAFLDKDYVKASELYTKTIAQNGNDADYARFQKSTLLGLQGKSAEQADILLQIIAQKNPESKYKYEAHYALGDLHLDANKYEDAINHFQKINDLTAKHLAAKAMMKIGFAYQEADNDDKAIETYKKVVQNYPNAEQRNAALEALKNLYVSNNKPNEYVRLLKDNGLNTTDNAGLDSLFYSAAETQYAAGKYAKATEAMGNYLQQYPLGIFKTKANFYKAESHYQLKEYDAALKGYDAVLTEAWSDFTEPSALKASALAMAQNNYAAADKYFGILRGSAIGKDNLKTAYKGLMLSAKNQNKNELSNSYADTLLTIPELDDQSKQEALLIKGNAALSAQKYDEAGTYFEQLITSKNIDIAAEAYYRQAELIMLQNKLSEAESAANTAIQKSTNSNYWNTKSYLLMVDVFIAQKDYFNAKATLQSIIKNVKFDALKKEATAKLEQVKALEKGKSKLSEG